MRTKEERSVRAWAVGDRPFFLCSENWRTLKQGTIVHVIAGLTRSETRYTVSELDDCGREGVREYWAVRFYQSPEEWALDCATATLNGANIDVVRLAQSAHEAKVRAKEIKASLPALRKALTEAKKAYAATQKKDAIAAEDASS